MVFLVGLQNIYNHALNFTRGIEFPSFFPGVRRELLDEIFICVPEQVGADVIVSKIMLREMIDEALECLVWEFVFIREV